MSVEQLPNQIGREFGQGLRNSSGYKDTQRLIEEGGLSAAVLNKTPPVGLNLRLITEMPTISSLRAELENRPIRATILGLAIADGVPDFQKFLGSALGTEWNSLSVIDIDDTILQQVDQFDLQGVTTHCIDARNTGIDARSQDLVLRDHLGNCCPPVIDRQVDQEASRITRPGGLSIVNITTSDLLLDSRNRDFIPFRQVTDILGATTVEALQSHIYDLSQLKREFDGNFEPLRGKLIEIEPDSSFVVFGEDPNGHGEWFRSLTDHKKLWENDGFEIVDMKMREGDDSHDPPLRCRRFNIILRQNGMQ